jgi:hypothetical protein
MPFVFLLSGLALLVVVVQGNAAAAASLLKSEFTGQRSFVPWVSAIVILCALGYVRSIRPVTDSFVGLIILVMIVVAESNGQNFFASFNSQLRNPVAPPGNSPTSGGQTSAAQQQQQPYAVLPGAPNNSTIGTPITTGPYSFWSPGAASGEASMPSPGQRNDLTPLFNGLSDLWSNLVR